MKIFKDYQSKAGINVNTLLEVSQTLPKKGYDGVSKIIAPLVETEIQRDISIRLLLDDHISKVANKINMELLYFKTYAAQKWSIANDKLKKDTDNIKKTNENLKQQIDELKKKNKPYGHLSKQIKPEPKKEDYYDKDDETLFKFSTKQISSSPGAYNIYIRRYISFGRKSRDQLSTLPEFLYVVKNVKTKSIRSLNEVLATKEISKSVTEQYIDWLKVNGFRLKLNIILRESNVVIFRYMDPKFREIWNRWNFCIILSVNEKKKTMRCLNLGMINSFYKKLLLREVYLSIKSLRGNRKVKIKAQQILNFLKKMRLENLITEYRIDKVTYDCFKVNLKNEFLRLADLNTEAFTIASRDVLYNKFRYRNKYTGEEHEDDELQE